MVCACSGESCCYYHGYVLAEMSVQQTRAHFLRKYGSLVDRPEIGRDLTEVYWRPGNTEPFLELVERLTGSALSADAWVAHLQRPVDERRVHPLFALSAGHLHTLRKRHF